MEKSQKVDDLSGHGESTSTSSNDVRTPLTVSPPSNGHEEITKMKLEYGEDLGERDRFGNTALIDAILRYPFFDSIPALIQLVKDRPELLNAQNNDGLTALMQAVNVTWMLKVLIASGADVNIKDKYGNTALFYALFSIDCDHEEVLRAMINAGYDVSHQNKAGLSPVMVAATNFNKTAISILLDSGADINAVSRRDNTSTALSCILNIPYFCEKAKSCIKLLLDRGGRFNYVSPVVLFNMILHGYIEVIPQLLRCGLAPADVKSHKIPLCALRTVKVFRVSPLSMALLFGQVNLAHYFMENRFLTQSDVSRLRTNKKLRSVLRMMRYQECLDFLDQINKQPFSLFTMSFVSVSSAVSWTSGREKRVDALSLPHTVKDSLVFKSQDACLVVPEVDIFSEPRSSHVGRVSWDFSLLDGDRALLKQISRHPDMFSCPLKSFKGIWGIANTFV